MRPLPYYFGHLLCRTLYRAENFITVLTPAVYDYQYLPEVAVSKKSHVTFRVRAGADAHVALSTMYGDTDRKTFELVLGGWNNSRTAIRYLQSQESSLFRQ